MKKFLEYLKIGVLGFLSIIVVISICLLDSESSVFFWIALVDLLILMVITIFYDLKQRRK